MNNPQLESKMRNLAERVAAIEPPEGLEDAVMAAFDRAQRRRRGRWLALGGALAASLVAGALLSRPIPAPAPAVESQAFYPIPYTPPLEPYERVLVVEKQVPVDELIAAGFHISAAPGATVRADVMVSQDGRPRAIRPVAFHASERSLQ
ncbi:MAG TPA: hypothetical protein VMB03_23920 [Bryobacteraceae bacterium]|nr:hypothetical protein [Bryobacteraceae bacterium]